MIDYVFLVLVFFVLYPFFGLVVLCQRAHPPPEIERLKDEAFTRALISDAEQRKLNARLHVKQTIDWAAEKLSTRWTPKQLKEMK